MVLLPLFYILTHIHSSDNGGDQLDEELDAILCASYNAYASVCADYSIVIEWRTAELCRKYYVVSVNRPS